MNYKFFIICGILFTMNPYLESAFAEDNSTMNELKNAHSIVSNYMSSAVSQQDNKLVDRRLPISMTYIDEDQQKLVIVLDVRELPDDYVLDKKEIKQELSIDVPIIIHGGYAFAPTGTHVEQIYLIAILLSASIITIILIFLKNRKKFDL